MKIHFLKTQWSDIILIEHNAKYALVDTGMNDQYVQITDYLDSLGIKELEFILLTHFHRDHYGNIVELIKNYEVKKVLFKEYGGHDFCTAWGSVADDEYRENEKAKWQEIKDNIVKYSSLQMVEQINSFDFEGITFYLYSNENSVKRIWEDESFPETYHQNKFSENQNSLAVFFEVNGKTVFFGGDIMDHEASHPLANYVNLQIAKKINKQIYLYKAPHHGTNHTACEETLSIYRPKQAVITNGMEWLQNFDTIDALKKANPDVDIVLTEKNNVIIEL